MLLRLLPAPTATQSNPPTILFTLPLPTQPYTARSLPLPPNLLAHRSVCLQEDIDCPNVLLGDKASWITGIIDDVTFSLVSLTVTINFIDGTTSTMPVAPACAEMLRRVCLEVHLSFAPVPSPTPEATASHSRSSSSSSMSARRSPSALLFSLLSPLLPSPASPRIPPARIHRRQARSLLVDTFRRFVLPALKADMPAAYLPWAVQSESSRRLAEFERLQAEVDGILAETGVEKGSRVPLQRYRTYSSGSESDDSMSCFDSRCASSSSLVTPATSIHSCTEIPSPQSFLLCIPPAHALPLSYQPAYTVLLQRLTHIASRLHAIKRLGAKYEKEESKRAWQEDLERGRQAEKAIRRAASNGELKAEYAVSRTTLRQSWTREDQTSDDSDSEDDLSPITPSMPHFDRIRISSLETCYEAEIEGVKIRRPSLERSQPIIVADESESDGEDLPSLSASSSTESLSSGDWDDELRTPSPPPTDGQIPEQSVKNDGYQWTDPYCVDPSRPQSRLGFRRASLDA